MRPHSSFHRLIALFTASSIAVIAITTLVFIEKLRVRELKHAEGETVGMARIISDQTTRVFQSADLAMRVGLHRIERYEASGIPLRDLAVHDMLKALTVNMPHIRSMYVVDADGTLASSSREFPMGRLYLADRDYFQVPRDGLNGILYIGSPLAGRTDGSWTLHLSRAIRRHTGEFGGVIVVAMDLGHFESLFGAVRLDAMGPISLYKSDGVLVARHPQDDQAIGKIVSLPALPSEGPDSDRRIVIREEGAHPGVITYDRIDQFPMVLSVGNQDAQALGDWREFARAVIPEASLWAGLLLVAGILLWRHREREETLTRQMNETGARLSSVVTAAIDAIITTDRNQAIVGVNPAAERMFGYKAARIVGQPVEQLFSGSCPLGFASGLEPPMEGPIDPGADNAIEEAAGLRADGSTFPVEMTGALAIVGDQMLYSAILRDISKRRATEDDLSRSHAQLRELAVALQTIREEERTTIARELHDELGQHLMRMSMDLSWLTDHLPGLSPKLHERATDMMRLLAITVDSLRRVTTHLRPAILDDLGLADAVRWQLDDFAKSTGIEIVASIAIDEGNLDKKIATDVFRVLQESLTNIARHAAASKVDVSLLMAEQELVLEIHDDGRGMDLKSGTPKFSHGLVGIRERVLALGGSSDISSAPGNGFTVRVRIPLVTPELPGVPT